jgi:hypothetical protein
MDTGTILLIIVLIISALAILLLLYERISKAGIEIPIISDIVDPLLFGQKMHISRYEHGNTIKNYEKLSPSEKKMYQRLTADRSYGGWGTATNKMTKNEILMGKRVIKKMTPTGDEELNSDLGVMDLQLDEQKKGLKRKGKWD